MKICKYVECQKNNITMCRYFVKAVFIHLFFNQYVMGDIFQVARIPILVINLLSAIKSK